MEELDLPFNFEAEPVSGVFEKQRAETGRLARFAEQARRELDAEAAVALDVSRDEARLAIVGSPLECSAEKEAVLACWMQEVSVTAVRTTPPRLLLLLGCFETLVVPVYSPARQLGAIAVCPPPASSRAMRRLDALAAELALTLEWDDRHDGAPERSDERETEPAPPPELYEHVA